MDCLSLGSRRVRRSTGLFKMSKFIYFPSFSAGAMGSSLAKNVKLKNGLSIRFYSEEFPEKYRHTDILITAGHHFKKDDYVLFRSHNP